MTKETRKCGFGERWTRRSKKYRDVVIDVDMSGHVSNKKRRYKIRAVSGNTVTVFAHYKLSKFINNCIMFGSEEIGLLEM